MSEANAFPYGLEPLFSVGWGLYTLQWMGHPVPEGVLDTFYFGGGQVAAGGKVSGEFRREGSGRIVVRKDGVGVIDVRATLDTTAGALIAVTYQGRLDLREDGYRRYLEDGFPRRDMIPLPMAVRFHTTYPTYLWLNRLQGVGIGLIEPARAIVAYDVYTVRYKNTPQSKRARRSGGKCPSATSSACTSGGHRLTKVTPLNRLKPQR